MKYYIRKITPSKFPRPEDEYISSVENLQADAVGDIRTSRNTLSIWEVDSHDDISLDDGVFALITSPAQSSLDKVDFIIFSEQELEKYNLKLIRTDGDTLVNDLKCKHRDIIELTYGSMRGILEIISKKTIAGDYKRRTKAQIKKILESNFNRIEDIDRFNEGSFLNELKKIEESL